MWLLFVNFNCNVDIILHNKKFKKIMNELIKKCLSGNSNIIYVEVSFTHNIHINEGGINLVIFPVLLRQRPNKILNGLYFPNHLFQ